MNTQNDSWIEANLQRQRRMLENKQKAKRHQSAGSVRTTSTGLSMGSMMNEYPTFDSSAPPPSLFSDPMSSSVNNIGTVSSSPSSTFHTPQSTAGYKMASQTSSSSYSIRTAPKTAPEPLISFGDQSDQELLSAKLSKANLSKHVASDDEEEDNSNARDYSGVPWKNGVKADNLQTEKLPDYTYIRNNLPQFVDEPVAERCLYKCTILRKKHGIDRSVFPDYFLYLEEGDIDKKTRIFLLGARKRKKSATANYLISCDATNLSKGCEGYCAKVRSNALGTHFTIYDNGANPKKTNNSLRIRQELAAVIYETNVLGFKGPRKMTAIIPGIEPATENKPALRLTIRPIQDKHTLLERYKVNDQDGIKILNNKSPQWNEETQSYVLNFHGRVTQASVKNFQIIHPQSPEYIIMQFGRVSDDEFTMDFRYPLSAIQAFGIAMTSFHGKLACE